MRNYTTISLKYATRAEFERKKYEYYGEDLAQEVSHDKFVRDLMEEIDD